MSVIALSLPEMLILRKVLKPQLIAIFIAIVGVAIVLTGYLFNLIIWQSVGEVKLLAICSRYYQVLHYI
jgi:hypothetical protein